MKSVFLQNGLSALFFGLLASMAGAQKTKIESGFACIRIETNCTEEQSKQKTEDLAKISAIEKAYGSYVEQQANISIHTGKAAYSIIGQTKVKGEWLKTLEGPYFEKELRDEQLCISCKITGLIREFKPCICFESKTLSCPDLKCESCKFQSGEQLYLYFRSPVDGYLSIYLDDGKLVNRLFPYSSSYQTGGVKTKADKSYFLFADEKPEPECGQVEELELYTSEEIEFNSLYFVFSEDDYFKPILDQGKVIEKGYLQPRSMNKKKFEDWLSNNRAMNSGLTVRTRIIEINSIQ